MPNHPHPHAISATQWTSTQGPSSLAACSGCNQHDKVVCDASIATSKQV